MTMKRGEDKLQGDVQKALQGGGFAWAVTRSGEIAAVSIEDFASLPMTSLSALCMSLESARMASDAIRRNGAVVR